MTKKPSKPKRNLPARSLASSLLLRVAKVFDKAGQPFVVIGGQAVIRHGHVRFTRDVDVTVPLDPYAYPKLVSLLNPLGITYRDEKSQADVIVSQVLRLQDHATDMGFDVSFMPTAYALRVIERAVRFPVRKYAVPFLAPIDLIVFKVLAGRPQDHVDAVEIINRYPDVDADEIRHWLLEYEQVLEGALVERFEAWRREALS